MKVHGTTELGIESLQVEQLLVDIDRELGDGRENIHHRDADRILQVDVGRPEVFDGGGVVDNDQVVLHEARVESRVGPGEQDIHVQVDGLVDLGRGQQIGDDYRDRHIQRVSIAQGGQQAWVIVLGQQLTHRSVLGHR